MATITTQSEGRGIESVARHFLTRSHEGAAAPYRMPPCQAEDESKPAELPVEPPEKQTVEDIVAEAVFADHLPEHEEKILAYADFVATREEQIALIKIDQWEAKWIQDLSGDGISEPENPVIAETEDIPGSLIPAIQEMAESLDIILVNFDQSIRDRAGDMIHKCSWLTVLCTPHKADMIETYKTIKWLVQEIGWQEKIAVFICLPEDETLSNAPKKAEEIFNKLADVSREHLHAELHLIGFYPSEESQPSPKEEPMQSDNFNSSESHKPEELFENMNMSPGFSGSRQSATRQEMPPAPSQNMPEMKMSSPFGHPMVYSPVEVPHLPRSSDELSSVLQLQMPQWLNNIASPMILPIPLPRPISPGIRLLVDGNGRLYIFHASLSDDYDLFAEAMTARNWLNQNLMLVQNYCPQLRFDRTQEIGMILVTGGSTDTIKTASEQIPCPVHLMKLHLLQNGSQWSLLILPQ